MPPTRPTVFKPQTSCQVKAAYKKNGPRLSEHEMHTLQRAAELDQRAQRIKEQEEKRRIAKRKREEKERKEREARKQLGMGLATQMAGYNHTQKRMKSGMEAFLGLSKARAKEQEHQEKELNQKLEAAVEDLEKELWEGCSDGELDIEAIMDEPLPTRSKSDQWNDDDIDDAALLQVHDLVVSDSSERPFQKSKSNPPQLLAPPSAPGAQTLATTVPGKPTPAMIQTCTNQQAPSKQIASPEERKPKSAVHEPTRSTPGEEAEFAREHGPINPAVERFLQTLPQPLIELCSKDRSILPTWTPEPSLLHRLNPAGIPPHRLRIKVGCAVTLLQDVNTSIHLPIGSQLQILNFEKARLECVVLDGQLNGTKTFLTRVPFTGRYRNDDRYPYKRVQFPVRVSIHSIPPKLSLGKAQGATPRRIGEGSTKWRQNTPSSGIYSRKPPTPLPQVSPHPLRAYHVLAPTSKKHYVPPPKPPVSIPPNPHPSLPQSLPSILQTPLKPSNPLPALTNLPSQHQPVVTDSWDDFLASGTQIARELSSEKSSSSPQPVKQMSEDNAERTAYDVDFTLDELVELAQSTQELEGRNGGAEMTGEGVRKEEKGGRYAPNAEDAGTSENGFDNGVVMEKRTMQDRQVPYMLAAAAPVPRQSGSGNNIQMQKGQQHAQQQQPRHQGQHQANHPQTHPTYQQHTAVAPIPPQKLPLPWETHSATATMPTSAHTACPKPRMSLLWEKKESATRTPILSRTAAHEDRKSIMPPPPPPRPPNAYSNGNFTTIGKRKSSDHGVGMPPAKCLSPDRTGSMRQSNQGVKPALYNTERACDVTNKLAPKPTSASTSDSTSSASVRPSASYCSFKEFGISTQDVVSFIEDSDDEFS